MPRRLAASALYAVVLFVIGAVPLWAYVLMWPWPSPVAGGWIYAAIQVGAGAMSFGLQGLFPEPMRKEVGSTTTLWSAAFTIPAVALVAVLLGPYWQLRSGPIVEVATVDALGDNGGGTVIRVADARVAEDMDATGRFRVSQRNTSTTWELRVAPIVSRGWNDSTPVNAFAVAERSPRDLRPMTFQTGGGDGLTLIRLTAERAPSSFVEEVEQSHSLQATDDAQFFRVVPSVRAEQKRLWGTLVWWYIAYLIGVLLIAARTGWSLSGPPTPAKPRATRR